MTTSGVTTLSYTVNDIFSEALDDLGVIGDGQTISGNYFSRCKKACNMLLQEWKAQGAHLWTQKEGYLFITSGATSYDFASARVVNSYTKTTTSAASSSGGSNVTVTSATGISNADVIGVLLDGGSIQWTTVNGAPAGSVVTLTDALTDDVASGNAVYHYSASATFSAAERVMSVRTRDASGYEIDLNMLARDDYFSLPDKDSTGFPVAAYTDRQRDSIVMYLWPTPDTSIYVIPFSYERRLDMVTQATETIDIPEYWFNALTLNLALRVALRFGCSLQRYQLLSVQAKDALDLAMTFDKETTDFRFKLC